MMPLPGFQNQTPYLEPAVAAQLYTLFFMSLALNLGLDQVVTVDGGGDSHLDTSVIKRLHIRNKHFFSNW